MRITIRPWTIIIVFPVISTTGSYTDIVNIGELIQFPAKGDPCFFCGRAIRLRIKPAMADTLNESVGKHCRTGSLLPKFGIVYQLAP